MIDFCFYIVKISLNGHNRQSKETAKLLNSILMNFLYCFVDSSTSTGVLFDSLNDFYIPLIKKVVLISHFILGNLEDLQCFFNVVLVLLDHLNSKWMLMDLFSNMKRGLYTSSA